MPTTWLIVLLVLAAVVVFAVSVRPGSGRRSPAQAQTIGIVAVVVAVVAVLAFLVLRGGI